MIFDRLLLRFRNIKNQTPHNYGATAQPDVGFDFQSVVSMEILQGDAAYLGMRNDEVSAQKSKVYQQGSSATEKDDPRQKLTLSKQLINGPDRGRARLAHKFCFYLIFLIFVVR